MDQPVNSTRARIAALIAGMTLDEKLAQLVGVWVEAGAGPGAEVAPLQDAMEGERPPFEEFARHGLGQITRFYGTAPVDPQAASDLLRERQRWLVEHTRTRIPAIVHEECLTGLMSWQATTFPAPLSWGASFDPALVHEVGVRSGRRWRHWGSTRALRRCWTSSATPGGAGSRSASPKTRMSSGRSARRMFAALSRLGIVATLKHFVGYSASRAGRNFAPTHAGPREVTDVLLLPFEMAVLDGHARSAMHSYAEVDGLPAAADRSLLTGILRDRWGFDGVVVSDYFGVAFLASLHGVAADLGDAAAQALDAGVDIELPTGNAYRAPLADAVRAGAVDEALVDRALERVLRQKAELGLLDATFDGPAPVVPSLDPAAHRALARRLAEEAVVLLANHGTLPLSGRRRIAVVGPNADRSNALFGCYSFANHVLDRYPDVPPGIDVPSVLGALAAEYEGSEVLLRPGVRHR